LWQISYLLKPLLDKRILVQRELSVLVLTYPRLIVSIDGSDTAREYAFTISLLQLSLQDIITPCCLFGVTAECILVLHRVVMPVVIISHRLIVLAYTETYRYQFV
jgi:hypothetical protein